MELEDNLRVCLRALESRYPFHVIDINEFVLGHRHCGAECWSSSDMIDYLQAVEPDLLDTLAHLVVDIPHCAIYLPQKTGTKAPAFIVHCLGRVPERRPSRPLTNYYP